VQNRVKELLGMTNVPTSEYQREHPRPPWDHIFLREALLWSERSHDAETQCGCVLVKDKTVLSTGYNGFIRDIDETMLPNLRPHKYPFMLHAELNAILNCARLGKPTLGATAYITTKPCFSCFQMLYQAGIVHIVYSNFHISQHYDNNEADDQITAMLMLINPTEIRYEDFALPQPTTYTLTRLVMTFIDKNDVLPKK